MTLFNYSKCECCNNKKNETNLTLYNLLPANLCNRISEYNVYCNQCCITRDLEQFFVVKHKGNGYTTTIQILYDISKTISCMFLP